MAPKAYGRHDVAKGTLRNRIHESAESKTTSEDETEFKDQTRPRSVPEPSLPRWSEDFLATSRPNVYEAYEELTTSRRPEYSFARSRPEVYEAYEEPTTRYGLPKVYEAYEEAATRSVSPAPHELPRLLTRESFEIRSSTLKPASDASKTGFFRPKTLGSDILNELTPLLRKFTSIGENQWHTCINFCQINPEVWDEPFERLRWAALELLRLGEVDAARRASQRYLMLLIGSPDKYLSIVYSECIERLQKFDRVQFQSLEKKYLDKLTQMTKHYAKSGDQPVPTTSSQDLHKQPTITKDNINSAPKGNNETPDSCEVDTSSPIARSGGERETSSDISDRTQGQSLGYSMQPLGALPSEAKEHVCTSNTIYSESLASSCSSRAKLREEADTECATNLLSEGMSRLALNRESMAFNISTQSDTNSEQPGEQDGADRAPGSSRKRQKQANQSASDTPGPSSNRKSRGKKRASEETGGNEDDDDDDDEEEQDYNNSKCNSHGGVISPACVSSLKVCPYFLRDPYKFHVCSKHVMRTISILKQHLGQNHQEPEFYCRRCGLEFECESSAEDHMAGVPCDGVNETPPINIETWANIKTKQRKRCPCDVWQDIYAALFPGERARMPNMPIIQDLRELGGVSLLLDLFNAYPAIFKSLRDNVTNGQSTNSRLACTTRAVLDKALATWPLQVKGNDFEAVDPATTDASSFSEHRFTFFAPETVACGTLDVCQKRSTMLPAHSFSSVARGKQPERIMTSKEQFAQSGGMELSNRHQAVAMGQGEDRDYFDLQSACGLDEFAEQFPYQSDMLESNNMQPPVAIPASSKPQMGTTKGIYYPSYLQDVPPESRPASPYEDRALPSSHYDQLCGQDIAISPRTNTGRAPDQRPLNNGAPTSPDLWNDMIAKFQHRPYTHEDAAPTNPDHLRLQHSAFASRDHRRPEYGAVRHRQHQSLMPVSQPNHAFVSGVAASVQMYGGSHPQQNVLSALGEAPASNSNVQNIQQHSSHSFAVQPGAYTFMENWFEFDESLVS